VDHRIGITRGYRERIKRQPLLANQNFFGSPRCPCQVRSLARRLTGQVSRVHRYKHAGERALELRRKSLTLLMGAWLRTLHGQYDGEHVAGMGLRRKMIQGARDDGFRLLKVGYDDNMVNRGGQPRGDGQGLFTGHRGHLLGTVDAPLTDGVEQDDHQETQEEIEAKDLHDPEDTVGIVQAHNHERQEDRQHEAARNLIGPVARVRDGVKLEVALSRQRVRSC